MQKINHNCSTSSHFHFALFISAADLLDGMNFETGVHHRCNRVWAETAVFGIIRTQILHLWFYFILVRSIKGRTLFSHNFTISWVFIVIEDVNIMSTITLHILLFAHIFQQNILLICRTSFLLLLVFVVLRDLFHLFHWLEIIFVVFVLSIVVKQTVFTVFVIIVRYLCAVITCGSMVSGIFLEMAVVVWLIVFFLRNYPMLVLPVCRFFPSFSTCVVFDCLMFLLG